MSFRVCFTIGQNSKLYSMNQLIDCLPLATGDGIERGMTKRVILANIERLVQVVFGNVVNFLDRVKSHPGTNSVDVP